MCPVCDSDTVHTCKFQTCRGASLTGGPGGNCPQRPSINPALTVCNWCNRIQLIQKLYGIQLSLLLKAFRPSIYVLIIVVLHCITNLALNLGISTSIDARYWRQWYYNVRSVNETFDPCDVTARSASYLVRSSFVRRLQYVLLSVITPWVALSEMPR